MSTYPEFEHNTSVFNKTFKIDQILPAETEEKSYFRKTIKATMEENYTESNENFIEFEATLSLTNKEIFNRIWTSPRMVFKFINDNKYDKLVTPLLIMAGIANSLDKAAGKDVGDDSMGLVGIILISVVAGGLFGWISYYIYAALLSWSGKWLDGKGNTDSIIRVIAYAMIPSILAIAFLIPQLLIQRSGIFQTEDATSSTGIILNIISYGCAIVQVVLGIWTMVLCIIGLSEVQKFSIGKAILNFFLPILFIVIPIIIIIFLFR
ncbi:Yip1 family protein [Flavobacterium enshiense]|uniref:Yip1 family protein n=1 Tax=Flavobacterium enshiense TaxID=1341165 RepID=UPI00345CFF3B